MKTVAFAFSLFIGIGLFLPCIGAEAPPISDANDAPDTQQTPAAQTDSFIKPLMAAKSPLAVDGELDIGTAPVSVPFMVEYPSFGSGHKVIMQVAGVNTYATPMQTTGTLAPLQFTIPKSILAPNYGTSVSVTYTVEVPGAPVQKSDPLKVKIMLDQLSAPEARLAVNGTLDVGKAPLQVPFTVVYPSLSAAHKVTLVVGGTPAYKTVAQTTSGASALTFNVPREILAKELGKSVDITYTVEIAGVPIQTSIPMALHLDVGSLPPPNAPIPEGVNLASSLNGRYADTREKCGRRCLPTTAAGS